VAFAAKGDAMALRIFVTRYCDRLLRKSRLNDQALPDAVLRAERGLVGAQLGHFLIK